MYRKSMTETNCSGVMSTKSFQTGLPSILSKFVIKSLLKYYIKTNVKETF